MNDFQEVAVLFNLDLTHNGKRYIDVRTQEFFSLHSAYQSITEGLRHELNNWKCSAQLYQGLYSELEAKHRQPVAEFEGEPE